MELRVGNAKLRAAFLNEAAHLTCLADTRKVSFHVSHEARYTRLTEGLGEDLEGDGLTGTGGTGDETVTVGHLTHQVERPVVAMRNIELVVVSVHIVDCLIV